MAILWAIGGRFGHTQQLIVFGPYGEPRSLMNESGDWQDALNVLRSPSVDSFIPDVTTPGWIYWNKKQFLDHGTYQVYLYDHIKKASFCLEGLMPGVRKDDPKLVAACNALKYERRLLLVNTRANTVTIRGAIYMDSTASYNPSNQTQRSETISISGDTHLARAIRRINQIVEAETH